MAGMISIDDRADGASKLKEAIEKEFYESFHHNFPDVLVWSVGFCKVVVLL